MAYVQIPKDLRKVKTKVAFNLTKRQLIGFSIAGSISVPVYLMTRNALGNEISMLLLIIMAFPVLFLTFYEKDGLKAEEYFKEVFLHQFYQPKKRIPKASFLKKKRKELEIEQEKTRRKVKKRD